MNKVDFKPLCENDVKHGLEQLIFLTMDGNVYTSMFNKKTMKFKIHSEKIAFVNDLTKYVYTKRYHKWKQEWKRRNVFSVIQ